MSPPEVWGPAVWNLFHTLIEKVNEQAYPYISRQLFRIFVRICKFLPCPECSNDSSMFLAKIKIENLKTKNDLKNTFYLFHNYVNAKKRKPLFNYSYMSVYKRYKLIQIVNNFFISYNTKGNMKLLAESFQRQVVVKDFKNWFTSNIRAFFPQINPPPANNINVKDTEESEETTVHSELLQQNESELNSNKSTENVLVSFDSNDIKCIEKQEEKVISNEVGEEEQVNEVGEEVISNEVGEEEQVNEVGEEEQVNEVGEEEQVNEVEEEVISNEEGEEVISN
jgi:hypothetical protein